jgi:hypothetical protein
MPPYRTSMGQAVHARYGLHLSLTPPPTGLCIPPWRCAGLLKNCAKIAAYLTF